MSDVKLAEYTKSRLLNASVVVGYLRSLIAATNELEIEVYNYCPTRLCVIEWRTSSICYSLDFI